MEFKALTEAEQRRGVMQCNNLKENESLCTGAHPTDINYYTVIAASVLPMVLHSLVNKVTQ